MHKLELRQHKLNKKCKGHKDYISQLKQQIEKLELLRKKDGIYIGDSDGIPLGERELERIKALEGKE